MKAKDKRKGLIFSRNWVMTITWEGRKQNSRPNCKTEGLPKTGRLTWDRVKTGSMIGKRGRSLTGPGSNARGELAPVGVLVCFSGGSFLYLALLLGSNCSLPLLVLGVAWIPKGGRVRGG